jgi:hypothetical protein
MNRVPRPTATAFLHAHPRCRCGEEASVVRATGAERDVGDFAGLVAECGACARSIFDLMMRGNESVCG